MERVRRGRSVDLVGGGTVGYERSSIGRAPVSKTGGWGVDSLPSCSSPPGPGIGRPRPFGPERRREAWRPVRPQSPPPWAGPSRLASTGYELRLNRTQRLPSPPHASETGAMGKVKDGVPASKAVKPWRGGASGSVRGRLTQFVANLGRVSLYKPMQG